MSMRICSNCMDFVEIEKRCPCSSKIKAEKAHPFTTGRGIKLSKQIKERDGFECKRCVAKGITDERKNQYLQTHHILSWRDFPSEAYNPMNLVCLCRSCNLELGTSNKLDFDWEPPVMKRKFVL